MNVVACTRIRCVITWPMSCSDDLWTFIIIDIGRLTVFVASCNQLVVTSIIPCYAFLRGEEAKILVKYFGRTKSIVNKYVNFLFKNGK